MQFAFSFIPCGGEVCVDRALMCHELNCLLQSALRPTGRMIDDAGRNKKKRVRNYAKLLCANGKLFVFTRSNNNGLSILALPFSGWLLKLMCGHYRHLTPPKSVEECDMQTLLNRLNQNGLHSPSATLIIRNFTFD